MYSLRCDRDQVFGESTATYAIRGLMPGGPLNQASPHPWLPINLRPKVCIGSGGPMWGFSFEGKGESRHPWKTGLSQRPTRPVKHPPDLTTAKTRWPHIPGFCDTF